MELLVSSSDREWVRGGPQPDGAAEVCPGQREHSSVLALAVGTGGFVPLP